MDIFRPIISFAKVVFLIPLLVWDFLMIIPAIIKASRQRARAERRFDEMDKARETEEASGEHLTKD